MVGSPGTLWLSTVRSSGSGVRKSGWIERATARGSRIPMAVPDAGSWCRALGWACCVLVTRRRNDEEHGWRVLVNRLPCSSAERTPLQVCPSTPVVYSDPNSLRNSSDTCRTANRGSLLWIVAGKT